MPTDNTPLQNSSQKSSRLTTVLVGMIFLALGCSSKETSPGPTREPVHSTVCKYNLQACHIKAKGMCTRSYWVESKIRRERTGGPWGAYSEYTMKFICK